MGVCDYDYVKRYLIQSGYWWEDNLPTIENCFDFNNTLVYPKKLYNQNEVEIYFFNKKTISILFAQRTKEEFKINSILTNKITAINFTYINEKDIQLEILHDDKIVLSSNDAQNSSLSIQFTNKILEIVALFIK